MDKDIFDNYITKISNRYSIYSEELYDIYNGVIECEIIEDIIIEKKKEENEVPRCMCILTKGKRKGLTCGKKLNKDGLCPQHKPKPIKKIEIKWNPEINEYWDERGYVYNYDSTKDKYNVKGKTSGGNIIELNWFDKKLCEETKYI